MLMELGISVSQVSLIYLWPLTPGMVLAIQGQEVAEFQLIQKASCSTLMGAFGSAMNMGRTSIGICAVSNLKILF